MEHGQLNQSQEDPPLNQSEASGRLSEDISFQNVSRLPSQYLVRGHSVTTGVLDDDDDGGDISSHTEPQVGYLDVSSASSKAGLLDKYLLSESSQSIDNFLTPSLGSVQSGLLEDSLRLSQAGGGGQLSNRSSLVLSEDDMRSVTSNGGRGAMEDMMVEVGNLDTSISHTDFQTALANRDAVIQKLSSNLHRVMEERREDSILSRKLEDEVAVLKDQVGIAIKKAAANKEFKEKYKNLVNENELLKQDLSQLLSQLSAKDSKNLELQQQLGEKDEEISTFASAKNDLIEKIQTIQDEVINVKSSNEAEEQYRVRVQELESDHVKEIEDIKEAHEKELESLVDKYEEEQVVEFNLLDHELDKLRDEKQELICELEAFKNENEILKHVSDETLDDEKIDRIHKDYQLIKDQLTKIESLYKEEMSRRESLQIDFNLEKNLRENLETDLANLGSFLDDTQYNFLPLHVQESVERSVRLSIESGALSPSRRESTLGLSLVKREGNITKDVTPVNLTMSETEYQIQELDMDATPTHKLGTNIAREHEEEVERLRAEHEREMSELRRYFENVCREMEVKYRAETEETIPQR